MRERKTLTVDEAARLLGVARATVYRAARKGQLPVINLGRRVPEGAIRGFFGAPLIVEDEATWVPDELYYSVRPMLAVSGGRLILMSTPFNKRGHFFDERSRGELWERVQAKATECARIAPEFLAEERASSGDWRYRQEYLCEFVETEDSVFSHDLVMGALRAEVQPLFGGEL